MGRTVTQRSCRNHFNDYTRYTFLHIPACFSLPGRHTNTAMVQGIPEETVGQVLREQL